MEESQDIQRKTNERGLCEEDHIDFLGGNKHNDVQDMYEEELQLKDLRNKVLFACQGLGGVRTIIRDDKKYQAYIKGPHCQQSVKDLIKFLRAEKATQIHVKLMLNEYKIVQSDLIELLILHVEDKRLSFWLIALLTLLTNKPHQILSTQQIKQLNICLSEYKQAFVKHQCLTVLIIHIADYFKLKPEQRFKAHLQFLQFSVALIRNLVQIKEGAIYSGNKYIHHRLILTLIRQQIFNPILYLIQLTDNPEVIQKIDLHLMEICYHTFTCFDPKSVYYRPPQFNFKIKAMQLAQTHPQQTRHSKFMPYFKFKNTNNTHHISHKLQTTEQVLPHQRKIPNRVSNLIKIQRLGHEYLKQNFLQMSYQSQDGKTNNYRKVIAQLTKQFLQIQLEQLCKMVFKHIQNNRQKIGEDVLMHYLLLCHWAVEMTTNKYQFQLQSATNARQRSLVQYDLSQIVFIMQSSHFQFLYQILLKEILQPKKKLFRVELFSIGLQLLLEYMNAIEKMHLSNSISDRKNAVILMSFLFQHEISKILKYSFELVIGQEMTRCIIFIVYKFYILLHQYAQGRAITVQTNRLLKVKTKHNNNNNKKQQIRREKSNLMEHQMETYQEVGEKQPNQFKHIEANKQKHAQMLNMPQQQLRFQQRKCNIVSELASVASYQIIDKYLYFLRKDEFTEDSILMQSIFYYFQQIVTLLKGEWLFFQANTIYTFQKILQNKRVLQKYKGIIRHICKSFIALIKKNQLALVQSLFPYPNLQIKDKIIKNYQEKQTPVKFKAFIQNLPNNGFTQQLTQSQFDNSHINEAHNNIQRQQSNYQRMPVFGDSQFLGSLDMTLM